MIYNPKTKPRCTYLKSTSKNYNIFFNNQIEIKNIVELIIDENKIGVLYLLSFTNIGNQQTTATQAIVEYMPTENSLPILVYSIIGIIV